MKKRIIALAILALLAVAIMTARTIPGGLAWDFGGFDRSGLFLCPASGHISPAGEWIEDWSNPLAPLFPDLVADC